MRRPRPPLRRLLPRITFAPYTPYGMVPAYDPDALPARAPILSNQIDPDTPVFVDAAGNALPFPVTGEVDPPVREDPYRITLDTAPTDYEQANYDREADPQQAGVSASNSNHPNHVRCFDISQYDSVLRASRESRFKRRQPPFESRESPFEPLKPLVDGDFSYLNTDDVEIKTETGTLRWNDVKEIGDLSDSDLAFFDSEDESVTTANSSEEVPASLHLNVSAVMNQQASGVAKEHAKFSAIVPQTTKIEVNLPSNHPVDAHEITASDREKRFIISAGMYEETSVDLKVPPQISAAVHERKAEDVKMSDISIPMHKRTRRYVMVPVTLSAVPHEKKLVDVQMPALDCGPKMPTEVSGAIMKATSEGVNMPRKLFVAAHEKTSGDEKLPADLSTVLAESIPEDVKNRAVLLGGMQKTILADPKMTANSSSTTYEKEPTAKSIKMIAKLSAAGHKKTSEDENTHGTTSEDVHTPATHSGAPHERSSVDEKMLSDSSPDTHEKASVDGKMSNRVHVTLDKPTCEDVNKPAKISVVSHEKASGEDKMRAIPASMQEKTSENDKKPPDKFSKAPKETASENIGIPATLANTPAKAVKKTPEIENMVADISATRLGMSSAEQRLADSFFVATPEKQSD